MSGDDRRERRGFRVIRGGLADERRKGKLRIVIAPVSEPPFPVNAIVVEDDTYFVLGADLEMREVIEHPVRIWTEVHGMSPAEPGSVHIGGGRPLKLMAVVHDLSADPTWKEEWIARALDEVLRLAEAEKMRSLGLHVLGAVHGKLPPERFVSLLREALTREPPVRLERLWLISDSGLDFD